MQLIDTHCHAAYSPLIEEIENVIQDMKIHDVIHAITVGCDPETNIQAANLAMKYPKHFSFSLGCHPTEVQDCSKETLEIWKHTLKNEIRTLNPVALGECGFDDYHTDKENEERRKEQLIRQSDAFLWMIEQSNASNLPLIIHTRNTGKQTLEMLQKTGLKKGIIHCFSEDMQFAQEILSLPGEIFVSFSGILTYKNTSEIQEVARTFPIERILIETDSPWLSPDPKRKKINNPGEVEKVFQKLAKIREIDEEVLAEQLRENTRQAFPLLQF